MTNPNRRRRPPISEVLAIAFCGLLLTVPAAAQKRDATQKSQDEDWARTPKEIAFQNDSQWEDNRWQETDVGPFLAATIRGPGGLTLKGLAIRVGDDGQAAVCFDTARLQMRTAWTGEFLSFDPRRFGLIRPPQVAGTPLFSVPKRAGWARDGRFTIEPDEITDLGVERGYTSAGSSVTHLPKEWAAWRGFHLHGQRVVLSYTIDSTDVLESPWFVAAGDATAFVRTFEVGPGQEPVQLWAASPDARIAFVEPPPEVSLSQRQPVVTIGPRSRAVRFKLLIAAEATSGQAIDQLRQVAGPAEDLTAMTASDTPRWTHEVTTRGRTTEMGGPYVIDTLTLPFENPYNALFFTAGHDFFSDGSAAVCTVHGDVWTVSGIDDDLGQLRWRRYATGLFQPLGLRIVDDRVYVLGRDQITRLHDRNKDGEADFYENFNNDAFVSPRAHDYVTCLDTDADGNFYYIHARTGVVRVTADGSSSRSIADGFRNPNGLGVAPDGTVTAAPQQGQWTPESSLILVRDGGYYGFGGPRITPERPEGWDRPMCFIPRAMDNSGGGQVWVPDDRWGPLQGQMLHLSYGQCRLLLALTETVGEVAQGGTISFPTAPEDFESGIMRGRFNPHDGQLYVSGLRGWQTRSIRDGCLQRVRYTGGSLHLPTRVQTWTNGITLTFSDPLDRSVAEDPANYFAEQWNYVWSKEYGSPEYSVADPRRQGRDEVPVMSATLLNDDRTVFLEMPGTQPVMQLSITWFLSAAGESFRGRYAHTINAVPDRTFAEDRIVRRPVALRVPADMESRLEPGLEFQFTTRHPEYAGDSDSRGSRLLALRQPISLPPTPFLPGGPFALEANGTLRAALSGLYEFRITGNGKATLSINDQIVLGGDESQVQSDPLLVRKGHNRLRLQYHSPDSDIARMTIEWKGYDFDWEPVPPDLLFHDAGSTTLSDSQRRRRGRELFARSNCHRCHRTPTGEAAMFELSLAPPDLGDANQRFTADWLQRWLFSPSSVRPGTTMPAVLGTGADASQAAADITAFLLRPNDLGSEAPKSETAKNRAPRPDAALLYETLGCIACHHFQPATATDEYERHSLYEVSTKYRRGALAAFLRHPAKHHSATLMPNFGLDRDEAGVLASWLRSRASARKIVTHVSGDAVRGERLFRNRGCQQCHTAGDDFPHKAPALKWPSLTTSHGCVAADEGQAERPHYAFDPDDQATLLEFMRNDSSSLAVSHPVETSTRLITRLGCAACHDRDGRRSDRPLIMAEEGSGRTAETLPSLTWAGEKLQPVWTRKLLSGSLRSRSRPWLSARMPGFPGYADSIVHGLAIEHGLSADDEPNHEFDSELAKIGEELTRQTALDCRQCHGIGDQQPRGDENTKIALGINFTQIRERLRHRAYHRFMLDPPRFDLTTRMIKLSEDGLTTKLKQYFDASAHDQFEALWYYIQSLPAAP